MVCNSEITNEMDTFLYQMKIMSLNIQELCQLVVEKGEKDEYMHKMWWCIYKMHVNIHEYAPKWDDNDGRHQMMHDLTTYTLDLMENINNAHEYGATDQNAMYVIDNIWQLCDTIGMDKVLMEMWLIHHIDMEITCLHEGAYDYDGKATNVFEKVINWVKSIQWP